MRPLLFILRCFDVRTGVGDRVPIFAVKPDGFCVFVFVTAVLAVLPALSGARVQARALKQASHERQPLPTNVRLSCEEVQHRVHTAADEGDG